MNTHPCQRPVVILFLLVPIVVGAGCQLQAQPSGAQAKTVRVASADVESIPVVELDPLTAGDLATAIRDVSRQIKPAVVQIRSERVKTDTLNSPFEVPIGVGSGVIYDAQGHILTNDLFGEGVERLLVSLPDGRVFEAKLIGRDRQADLAVLQIDASGLPVARRGSSEQLRVGDWVIAIGNALALPGGPTVTVGVVSALGRSVKCRAATRARGPCCST